MDIKKVIQKLLLKESKQTVFEVYLDKVTRASADVNYVLTCIKKTWFDPCCWLFWREGPLL